LLAYRQSHQLRYASLAGLGLGVALLAKVANVVAWPLYLIYGFWIAICERERGRQKQRTMATRMKGLFLFAAAFGFPLAGACLVLVVYNLARSGHPLDLGYAADETFSTPLWRGLAGQLISPGKSIFLYSPILIAALFGIPSLFRRDRATALLALGVVAAYPLLYAGWFMWWGGWSWGPRFLVPTLPFLCLFLAPVVDWALRPGHRWAMGVLLVLGLLSVGIQVLGVTVDFNQYLLLLYERGFDSGDINFRVELSPLLGHWDLLRSGLTATDSPGWWDIAWARDGVGGVDWPRLLWPVALFAAALLGWWGAWKTIGGEGLVARAGRVGWAIVCTALVVVSVLALARMPTPASDWQAGGLELSDFLQRAASDEDVMIVDILPFGDHLGHTTSLLEVYKAVPAYWGWARQEPVSVERQVQLAAIGEKHRRLWLVLDTTPEADPASTTERWLDENAFRLASMWLSPAMRLVSYAWPGRGALQSEHTPLDLRVGDDLRLAGFGPTCSLPSGKPQESRCQGQGPIEAGAGDILTFSLLWRVEEAVEEDYTVFVQLLDQSGRLEGQIDRVPVGGFRQTSTWKPGEVIADHYGLELPQDLAPGHYQLIAGLYLPASGERLVVSDAGGIPLGNHVPLTSVIIAGEDGP
jgi:hypothetical protein